MKSIRTCLGLILGLAVAPVMADTCQTGGSSGNSDAGVTLASSPFGSTPAIYFSTPGNVPSYWAINSSPIGLGGNVTSEPAALADAAYVRGGNAELWEVTNTGVWTTLGGTITWNPTAVDTGASRMAFYRGSNQQIWYRERTGGAWGPHTSLGGISTSSPAAVSWGGGHVAVFHRGQANDVYYRERVAGVWGSWTGIGGNITVDPTVVTQGTGTYAVFGRAGGTVYINKYNGVWSGWVSLGGPPPGAFSEPGAVALSNGGYAVFVRGNTESYPGRQLRLVYKNVSMDGGTTWSGWTGVMAHSSGSSSNPEAMPYGGGYFVAASDVTNGYGTMTYCYSFVP